MILQLNYLQRKLAAGAAEEVVDTLYALLEEGHLEQEQFARLNLHLDWIQYRKNFCEYVMLSHVQGPQKKFGRYSLERPIKGLTRAGGARDTDVYLSAVYSELSLLVL